MNIDAMPAGPKMNELMATEIMGWQLSKIHLGFWATPLEDDCEYNHHDIDEWSPSTDIAAAWPIAERLRLCLIPRVDGGWNALPWEDVRDSGPLPASAGSAHTAPLAICRAALKAGEGDK